MALHTIITIAIGDDEYQNINDLKISQGIWGHHKFSVGLLCNHFEDDGTTVISKSQELIGQTVNITIQNLQDDTSMSEGYFSGIITSTEADKRLGNEKGDVIIIKGYSPTILMDDGMHCNSYEELSLSDIVNDAAGAYSVPFTINPLSTDSLAYTVQYNQSNFKFLKHLAAKYGEWFYYDGEQAVFGTQEGEEITLSYGVELTDFNLSLMTTPKLDAYVTNDYYNDAQGQQTLASGTSLPDYYSFMADKSESLYTAQPQSAYLQHSADGSQDANLEAAVGIQSEGRVACMAMMTGTTRNSGLKIGTKISIVHQTAEQDVEYGAYMVTKVEHHASEAGDYYNYFEAIPDGVVNPPYTNIHSTTNCPTQRAVVTENADPAKLGRIRVQFPWQPSTYSPWIRIAQPHAGTEKGFHFIPEIGEEVMVGFEGGNAEMPFVLGALYNGTLTAEEFTTDNNDVKVIRTRSGHTIELNDTDGEEKINIYDNEGSIITFDTQAQSLTINSTETLELSAKNINISAEENITIGAQQNIDIAAEGDLNAQAQGNVAIQSDGDTTVNSSGNLALQATSDATISGMSTIVEGQTSAEFNSVQTKVTGSAMTEVSGAILKLN